MSKGKRGNEFSLDILLYQFFPYTQFHIVLLLSPSLGSRRSGAAQHSWDTRTGAAQGTHLGLPGTSNARYFFSKTWETEISKHNKQYNKSIFFRSAHNSSPIPKIPTTCLKGQCVWRATLVDLSSLFSFHAADKEHHMELCTPNFTRHYQREGISITLSSKDWVMDFVTNFKLSAEARATNLSWAFFQEKACCVHVVGMRDWLSTDLLWSSY